MPNDPATPSLESLFREHYAALVRASARMTNDVALAEDVVQGVFLRVHERGELPRLTNPAAYLRRAVATRTINALRDRKRLTHPGEEDLASAAQQLAGEEPRDIADVKARLHSAIRALPDRARVILVLNRFEGLSYKEIAAELSIAPKTVENQLARALKLLRANLPRAIALLLSINFLDA